MRYVAPTGTADPFDPAAPYVGRNLGAGIQGSRVPPRAVEHPQREIAHAITFSGQTPSENDLEQLRKAMQIIAGIGALRQGFVAVESATLTSPGSPPDGQVFLIPVGASGDWSAHVGKLALRRFGGWTYITAPRGTLVQAGDTLVYWELWDQTGGQNWRQLVASETLRGLSRFATVPETQAGLLNTVAVTPAGLEASRVFLIINTTITKTVGGASPDFATLRAAFEWLSNYRITRAGRVTFQIRSGIYTETISLDLAHPDIDRVEIHGAPLINGGAPSSLQVTGFTTGAIAADKAANIATFRNRFPTELRFHSGASLRVLGPLARLQDLLIVGDMSNADGLVVRGNATLNRVVGHNFGQIGIMSQGAVATAVGPIYGVGNGLHGVAAFNQGGFEAVGGTIYGTNNAGNGLYAASSSAIRTTDPDGIVAGGNVLWGIATEFNSPIRTGNNTVVLRNGAGGIDAASGAAFSSLAVSASEHSNGPGVSTRDGAMLRISSLTSTGSAGGAVVVSNARADIDGGNLGGDGVTADSGAFVDLRGTSNRGTLSPAADTVGNANSFIRTV